MSEDFSSFWIGYFYYKDRFQPEPLKTIGMSYILGILSGLLCYQFYRLLPIIGIPDDPSALMDGIFDFFTTSSALRVVSSLLILMIWIWRMRILERSVKAGRKNVKILHR